MDFKEMTAGQRVKHLRKNELHMTQEQFAPSARITRGALASLEIGKVNLSTRVSEDICSSFGVNKKWLEDGEGDIFDRRELSELAYNKFGYVMENSSPAKKAALTMLLELAHVLPDDKWEEIMQVYMKARREAETEEIEEGEED